MPLRAKPSYEAPDPRGVPSATAISPDCFAMTDVPLNLRGLKCPLPALRVRKALKAAASGTLFIVECNDPMAAIDIPNLMRETGDSIEHSASEDALLIFHIRKA
ncbi:sulfurtransferase TusA family protein [Bosea sp. Leaf344]|uniref:sulfurtransferase TusA family protein n=1 Tax=Bosea sp. Leaf344 TaxID=1736346 RepID=UPI003299D6BD